METIDDNLQEKFYQLVDFLSNMKYHELKWNIIDMIERRIEESDDNDGQWDNEKIIMLLNDVIENFKKN